MSDFFVYAYLVFIVEMQNNIVLQDSSSFEKCFVANEFYLFFFSISRLIYKPINFETCFLSILVISAWALLIPFCFRQIRYIIHYHYYKERG